MSGVTDIVLKPASALKQGQEKFFGHLITQNERAEQWRMGINLSLVVGGGALAGMGKLSGIADPHASWMAGVGLGMVALGTIFVTLFDFRRGKLTAEAKDALSVAADFLDDKEALQQKLANVEVLDKRRRFLLIAIQQMHEAIERMPHETPVVTVIEAMLDAGSSDLEGAIGFEAGEKWAFSIFQREPDPDGGRFEVMQRIVVSFNDRQREKAREAEKPEMQTRHWKKKEGFTGVCWQHDDEVIEADLRSPEVASQYPVPKGKQKLGDEERYISVAVIPIKVGSANDMWGCVTATSNVPDRWRRAVNDPREHNVMVVRQLAQLIAMQVALRDGVIKHSFKKA
ncbi:hypothetical protein EKN06_00510 [Croceicoccus ponticola]|uniref:GAF domain-containing protein n=1 Tax=Croceicoccus ponticola TaxID=2217664 RepID=A0A437GZF7_9SPHN|nr:hypothetical protein [Croceicoccus ponticola]RVQ68751.1 hypothetical protein EKN06_00510 [Croceicoccus ponticola]